MKTYDLIIIGGGPAGISCATSAYKKGVKNILLIERRNYTGGILNQCIHDGFGLLSKGTSLTGPEFAMSLEEELKTTKVQVETGAYVCDIEYENDPYEVTYISNKSELICCTGKSIVIATGCRERPYGSLKIPGTRPSGIFSAGSAQYMMNVQNILPGRKVVILGLGDIGMIMARRLRIEGAKVKMILGLEMTGLERNFKNCIEDLHIPCKVNHTVLSVHGHGRLKGVTIAPLDNNKQPILEKSKYISCDTLLVAAGLIPEDELAPKESKKGVYLCGNVHKIFSLVDHVKEEGTLTGLKVAAYINGSTSDLKANIKFYEDILSENDKQKNNREDTDYVTCIKCPKECHLHIIKDINNKIVVTGNNCPLGEEYGLSLMDSPSIVLTTTVKVKDEDFTLLPVRSNKPIPVSLIKDVRNILKSKVIPAETPDGFCLVENICNTGADIYVTNKNLLNQKV